MGGERFLLRNVLVLFGTGAFQIRGGEWFLTFPSCRNQRKEREDGMAGLSGGEVKPGRRTVEVQLTPVKEAVTLEVGGRPEDTPIKMVSQKSAR